MTNKIIYYDNALSINWQLVMQQLRFFVSILHAVYAYQHGMYVIGIIGASSPAYVACTFAKCPPRLRL